MSRFLQPRLSNVSDFAGAGQIQGSGLYIYPAHGGRTTGTITVNRVELIPIIIKRECYIDVIGFESTVVSTAGGVARCGIWLPGKNDDRPDVLVYGSGTIAVDSGTGAKEFTGLAQKVLPGLYWFGTVMQTASCTTRQISTSNSSFIAPDATAPTGTIVGVGGYTKTGVSGALADIGTVSGVVSTPTLTWAKLL